MTILCKDRLAITWLVPSCPRSLGPTAGTPVVVRPVGAGAEAGDPAPLLAEALADAANILVTLLALRTLRTDPLSIVTVV